MIIHLVGTNSWELYLNGLDVRLTCRREELRRTLLTVLLFPHGVICAALLPEHDCRTHALLTRADA